MMKNKTILNLCVLVCLTLSLTLSTAAKQEVSLDIQKVSADIYCIYGAGGNIAVLKSGGNDGLLVVDAKVQPVAGDVLKKITALSTKGIKYLVNTHYHGDHTGGNEIIGKNAVIIMHPNSKISLTKRLKARGIEKEYLSNVKPWSKEMVIKLGEETIRLLHFGAGHTAGDIVVVFEKAKVFHTGDLFFNEITPYIDVEDGCDTGNWIRTIESLCKKYPDYKIIPGHGRVTDVKHFLLFAGYLKYLRKEVAAAIKAGKTREQAMETIDVGAFEWLKEHGDFFTKKNNIRWVYEEMTRARR